MNANPLLLFQALFPGLLLIGISSYATETDTSETSVLDLADDAVKRDYVDSRFGQVHIRQVTHEDKNISARPIDLPGCQRHTCLR